MPQGDMTDRARAPVEEFRAYLCNLMIDLDEPEIEWMTDKLVAVLQSEREAAAAEARRAAIEECHIKALEQRCEPTFLNDGGVIHRAGERTPWDLACTTIADAISALASPPAPQEETR